jgi:hypothetical protein
LFKGKNLIILQNKGVDMTKIEKIIWRRAGELTRELIKLGKPKKYPNFIVKYTENTDFDVNLYFTQGRGIVRLDVRNFSKLLPIIQLNKINDLVVSLVQYAYYASQADNMDRAFLKKLQERI